MKHGKQIVVYGAGGSGREIAWLIEQINRDSQQWHFMGFIDDYTRGSTVEGHQILGGSDILERLSPRPAVVCSVGDPATRARIVTRLEEQGFTFATLIHPTVLMSGFVQVGAGSVICAGCVLTTNVKVGRHCLVNIASRIGHDSVLGDFASLMYGVAIAGDVTIGKGCYLGSNACVVNRISIGEWTVIGAGGVVVNDIPERVVAVGVPARPIKTLHHATDECGPLA